MKIVGLKVEKYIGQAVSGHNCDFNYHDEEFERHILFGILSDNKKVKITLYQTEGECYSGWCTASWGHIEVEEVDKFGGYTYIPKNELIVDDICTDMKLNDEETIQNIVFSVSVDGGDSYYPSGYYSVNMDLFKETPRNKTKRPVWVFVGKSNVGKSYIASHLKDLVVYETDSCDRLPNSITADIIVLGNKYNFSIEDVKAKIFGEFELCKVVFNVYE